MLEPLETDHAENAVGRSSLAGAFTVVNLGLKAIVQLSVVALCIRYLGREGAGLWVLLQAVSVYLGLADIGIGQTMINVIGRQYAHRDFNAMRNTFTTSFGLYWMIVLPICAVALLILTSLPVESWLLPSATVAARQNFRAALYLVVPLTLLRIPLTIFAYALLALRQTHIRQLYEIVLTLSTLVSTAVVLVSGGGFVSVVVWYHIVTLAVNLSVALLLPRYDGGALRLRPGSFRPDQLRPLFANSLFFLVIGLALFVDQSAGSILVGKFGTVSEVPVMFVMLTLLRVFGAALVNALSAVVQPYVILLDARGQQERIVFFAALASKASVFIAVVVTSCVWFIGSDLAMLWVGPGLTPPLLPLILLGFVFMIEALFSASSNFLIAMNRHRALAAAQAARTFLAVVLATAGAWMMPQRIFVGITLGMLLATCIACIFVLPAVTRREFRLDWRTYGADFIGRPLLLIAVAAFCMGLSIGVGNDALPIRVLWVVISFSLAASVGWWTVLSRRETLWLAETLRTLRGGR